MVIPMLVKPVAWLTMFSLFLAFLLVINNPYAYNIVFSGALIIDNFQILLKASF